MYIKDESNKEIPKYKKRNLSNVSKSNNKSNHKHKYVDCLLIYDKRPYKSVYCKVCGKIGGILFFETIKDKNNRLTMMTSSEIYEKYKNIETRIAVDSLYNLRFIPVRRENNIYGN